MTPTPRTRERVGAAVRQVRNARSLSIESAAKAGGIGHMTWRKIEHGKPVHDQSYYAVDRAFGWQSGHTLAAFDADDPRQHFADASEPESETTGVLQGFTRGLENSPLVKFAQSTGKTQSYLKALGNTGDIATNESYPRTVTDRIYDSPTGEKRFDTAFRFHDEFYLTLEMLNRLNVSEIRAVRQACAQYEEDTQQRFDAIQNTLEAAKRLFDKDAFEESARYTGDLFQRFTMAANRHMSAYHSVIEATVELYELTNSPVGDLKLDAFEEKAASLYNQLNLTTNELAELRGEAGTAHDQETE